MASSLSYSSHFTHVPRRPERNVCRIIIRELSSRKVTVRAGVRNASGPRLRRTNGERLGAILRVVVMPRAASAVKKGRSFARPDSFAAMSLCENRTGSNDPVRAMHVCRAETTTAASPMGHWTPRAAVPRWGKSNRRACGIRGGEKRSDDDDDARTRRSSVRYIHMSAGARVTRYRPSRRYAV